MNRRGFLKMSGVTALLSIFLPKSNAFKSDCWWKERSFKYKGYNATEWIWPRDRVLNFKEKYLDKYGQVPTFLCPTFDIRKYSHDYSVDSTIHWVMDSQIENSCNLNEYDDLHINLIRIEGLPYQMGVTVTNGKPAPVTDCWENCD